MVPLEALTLRRKPSPSPRPRRSSPRRTRCVAQTDCSRWRSRCSLAGTRGFAIQASVHVEAQRLPIIRKADECPLAGRDSARPNGIGPPVRALPGARQPSLRIEGEDNAAVDVHVDAARPIALRRLRLDPCRDGKIPSWEATARHAEVVVPAIETQTAGALPAGGLKARLSSERGMMPVGRGVGLTSPVARMPSSVKRAIRISPSVVRKVVQGIPQAEMEPGPRIAEHRILRYSLRRGGRRRQAEQQTRNDSHDTGLRRATMREHAHAPHGRHGWLQCGYDSMAARGRHYRALVWGWYRSRCPRRGTGRHDACVGPKPNARRQAPGYVRRRGPANGSGVGS